MKQNNNVGKNSPLFAWNGMAMFIGSSFSTDIHKHDCFQLTIDLKDQFMLKDANSEWTAYNACVITSNHYHQLDSNGSLQLFIYLDPNTDFSDLLIKKYLLEKPIAEVDHEEMDAISPDQLSKMLVNKRCDDWYQLGIAILNKIVGVTQKREKDARVDLVIKWILGAKSFPSDMITQLASQACISESRLRHLFREQVGQSLKSFILWAKVLRSLDLIMQGEKAIIASMHTGFWDGAHLDKTLNNLLGISPGAVEGFKEAANIQICNSNNFYTVNTEILNRS